MLARNCLKSEKTFSQRATGILSESAGSDTYTQSPEILCKPAKFSVVEAISRRTIYAFILGSARMKHLDRAEILWSNGRKETLQNLAADRFNVVREGDGVVPSKPQGRIVNLR